MANPLNRISGVGTVSVSGAPEREVQVNVIPQKLEAYNLSVEQIAQVIAAENVNVPAGNIDIGSQTYMLRLEGQFSNSDQLNNIIVGSSLGKPIYLRDVATVSDTLESRIQRAIQWRESATIVCRTVGCNSVQIADAVKLNSPFCRRTAARYQAGDV